MPSTENGTFDRIQKEIMDVMTREDELRRSYESNVVNNNNNHSTNDHNENNEVILADLTNGHKESEERPALYRAKSTPVLNVGEATKPQFRRFQPNDSSKGVMQRFLKSRGKLSLMSGLKPQYSESAAPTINTAPVIPDFQPPKFTPDQAKRLRNGYVSVEERMRRELQEVKAREDELRTIRRQSHRFESDDESDSEQETGSYSLNHTNGRSLNGASSCETLDDTSSAPSSLKPARSLADLCDVAEDEVTQPRNIIFQFEQMIMKYQQART